MSIKPILFLAFANERTQPGRYLRNLPQEARLLEAALSPARKSDLCELIVRHNVTAEELFNTFQSDEYRDRIAVFHFAGHANGYQLLLESSSGASEAAHASGLAHLLGQQQGLQLVFLNGCSTTAQSKGLLKAGIPMVISTTQTIDDHAATTFAQRFYAGLGSGESLERAYHEAEARIELSQSPNQSKRGVSLEPEPPPETDSWPWRMQVGAGADSVRQWNLPEAADNPLFGLLPLPRQDLPPSPFRHLHAFRREHAAVFFGRGALIRTLYERVTDADTAPIILFYGQSGVGKSSVLEAGLLPRLETHFQQGVVRREAAHGLWQTLHNHLINQATSNTAHTAWLELEQRGDQPLLLVFDQLEEVFTRSNPQQPEELQQFIDGLCSLFGHFEQRPQGKLILSYRKEYSPEIETLLSKARLPFNQVFVEALDQPGILEAIKGPTSLERLQQQYRLTVESGLAETIAHDLLADRGSPIAPVLQILLTRLWESVQHQAQPRFDRALYQTLKQQGLLLQDFLDQQFEALAQTDAYSEAVNSGLLLDVLMYFTTPRGTANERSEEAVLKQYAHQSTLCSALIEQCKVHYLLVSQSSEARQTVRHNRLCHDALAPLIRERFDASDRPGQRARRILESRTVEWQGEQSGTPLDAADLLLVERGAQGMRVWTDDEQRLMTASRQQRRKQQRQRRVWRAMGVLAIGLILVTTALTGWQWRVAEQKNRLSLAKQLAAQAKIAFDRGTGDGLLHSSLLAIESLKQAHTTQGTSAVIQASTLLPHAVTTLLTDPCYVDAVTFSPNGKWLATGERNPHDTAACNQARLWDAKTGQELLVLEHLEPVFKLNFNANNSVLATIMRSSIVRNDELIETDTVSLWETGSGKLMAVIKNNNTTIFNVRFSIDGSYIATANGDKTVRIYEANTWQEVLQLKHDNEVLDIKFSLDGKYILTAGIMLHVWNVGTGEHVFDVTLDDKYVNHKSITGPTTKRMNYVISSEFNSDSTHVAIIDVSGVTKIWDFKSGRQLHHIDFKKFGEYLFHASTFNHDISMAIASDSSRIYILDVLNKKIVDTMSIPSSRGTAMFMTLSHNQKRLFSAISHNASNTTGIIWDVRSDKNSKKEMFRLPMDTNGTGMFNAEIKFSPNDSLLATATKHKARIWKIFQESINLMPNHHFDMIPAYGFDNSRAIVLQDFNVNNGVIVRDYFSYNILLNTSVDKSCINCYINYASISLDKKFIAFSTLSREDYKKNESNGRGVQVYSADSGQLVANFNHKQEVVNMDINFNGSLLTTHTLNDNITHVWDVNNKKKLLELKHENQVGGIKFIPYTSLLIGHTSTYNNGYRSVLKVWNSNTGKIVMEQYNSGAFKFSPVNPLVAIITDYGVRIMNYNNWKLVSNLSIKPSVRGDSIDIFFSQDGAYLIAIYDRNTVAIWETKTWKITHKLTLDRDYGVVFRRFVSFNKNYNLIIIKGVPQPMHYPEKLGKQRVSILNLDTGEVLVREWIPLSSQVIGFSQDGRWWTTYNKDQDKIQQHPWRSEDIIADLCTRLPYNFTEKEWNQYMGDTPYQASCDNLPAP